MKNIWEKTTMVKRIEFYEDVGDMRISLDGLPVAELTRTEALALADAIKKHFEGGV